jgi:hypothetical protein
VESVIRSTGEEINMKKKIFRKKGLVVVVIGLFCCLGVTPAIATFPPVTLYDKTEMSYESKAETLTEIEVNEYKSDGSIETKLVVLTSEMVNNLKQILLVAKNSEERFSILKEYGLIPQEVSLEELREGMREKAKLNEFTKELPRKDILQYEGVDTLLPPVLLTFFSRVDAVYFMGNSIRIGLTPITMLINRLLGSNIPGIDLVDVCWGALGIISTRGVLGQHSLVCIPSIIFLAGFVGYSVKFPVAYHIYSGYSVMAFSADIGIHDFQPLLPS